MNYLTFLAAAICTLSLIEGLYVLSVNSRSPTNRLYFLMTASLSLWLFGAGMAYTAHTKEAVLLLFRISSFGFVFLHAFTLHFSIRISTRKNPAGLRYLLPLIYLPSLYFMYRSLTGLIVYRDFIRPEKLWLAIPAFGDISLLLLVIHYVSYYLTSAFLLVRWWKNTDSRREKKQARLMLISMVSTIFLFNLEPFILPLFTGSVSIAISPIFGILWVSGIGYAVWKYRLLRWDPKSMGSEILNNIDEAVFALDAGYSPIYMNEPAKRFLSPTGEGGAAREKDLRPTVEGLLRNNPAVAGELRRLTRGEIRDFSCRLAVPGDIGFFLDAKFSRVRDSFGDILGITFIGREVKDEIRFKALFTLTEKEMEVLRLIMRGSKTGDIAEDLHLSVRTVKYYLANIYTKLDVKNKIGLYNTLKTYHLFPEQDAEAVAFPLLMKKSKNGDGLAF